MGNTDAPSEDNALLRERIFAELGFHPNVYELTGEFSSRGWIYRGIGEVTCHQGHCDRSQQHVWQRPEGNKRNAYWAIVCDQCCRVSEIYQFDMTERGLLVEAKATSDQGNLAPAPTLRVGFFCCGPCPETVALIDLLNAERDQRPLAPSHKTDNYPLVLEVFQAIRADNSATKENLAIQLKELHSSFKLLRKEYRKGFLSRTVEIEYSGLVADAYLLGYVPGYINQAREALELAFVSMSKKRRLALQSRRLKIELHLFDLQTTGWSQTRDGLLDLGCRQRWPGELDVYQHQFDVYNVKALLNYQETLRSLDLAMFQNFDNEIGSLNSGKGAPAAETITKIAGQLPSGSQLVLSDVVGSEIGQKQLGEYWMKLGIGEVFPKQLKLEGSKVRIHPWPKDGLLMECFFSEDEKEWRLPRAGLHEINILVLNRA